jgi:HlyD family secretion protein
MAVTVCLNNLVAFCDDGHRMQAFPHCDAGYRSSRHSYQEMELPRIITLLLLLFLASCEPPRNEALGTLEWDRINGRAIASEVIQEIYVVEGDRVESGQALLRLDASLIDARIAQLQAEVERSSWLLKELEAGPRSQEIAEARARLEATESELATQRLELERQRELVKKNFTTERVVEQVANLVELALSRRKEAQEQLDLLSIGTRVERIEQAQAALLQAEAALRYENELLRRYTVRAERDGVVDSIVFKLGDKPAANVVVTTLLAGDRPFARVYVPETWRAQVVPGAEFPVQVDGVNETFTGRVRKISADPSFTPFYALNERDRARLSYLAELDVLEPAAARLAAGIPVQVILANP